MRLMVGREAKLRQAQLHFHTSTIDPERPPAGDIASGAFSNVVKILAPIDDGV